MKQVLKAVLAALIGAYIGHSLAEYHFKKILSTIDKICEVRSAVQEENCNVRILNILDQVDMECFGRWTTADGPITLYPEDRKEVADGTN